MLRVDWVIPCRYVEVNGGLASIIGAGIDSFLAPTLPGPVALTAAVRVLGLPDAIQHDLAVEILGPGMEVVGETLQGKINLAAAPGNPPGWEVQALLPMVMQFAALTEGTYTLNVSIDGASKSIPFRVMVGAPPA